MSTIEQLPSSARMLYEPARNVRVVEGATLARLAWSVPKADFATFMEIASGVDEVIVWPGGSITRRVPLKYPGGSFFADMYAYDIDATGIGQPSYDTFEGIQYSLWKIVVSFKTFDFLAGVGDYPLVSLSTTSGSDKVTRPGTAYKFPSDNLRIDHAVGVRVGGLDLALTMHWLPPITQTVLTLWTGLTGRVNSVAFPTPWGTFAAGYVQFLGFDASETYKVGNQRLGQVTHKFKYREVPHNQIMRSDGGGFEAPVGVTSGDFLIETANLALLYG